MRTDHVFLYLKDNHKWDILQAKSNISSTQSISKMYSQFKEISYLVRDLAIWLDNNSKLNFHQLQRYSSSATGKR